MGSQLDAAATSQAAQPLWGLCESCARWSESAQYVVSLILLDRLSSTMSDGEDAPPGADDYEEAPPGTEIEHAPGMEPEAGSAPDQAQYDAASAGYAGYYSGYYPGAGTAGYDPQAQAYWNQYYQPGYSYGQDASGESQPGSIGSPAS